MGGACNIQGRDEKCIQNFSQNTCREGIKKPFARHMHRFEDNIKMNLKEMGFENVKWIHMPENNVQWRDPVNTLLNLRISKQARNFVTK
jgi:hypothetical protein